MYSDPEVKQAQFTTLEPWLAVSVERTDKLGHIAVRGEAFQEPFFEGHNALQFTLEIDQSYLPEAIKGLVGIVELVPMIGSPYDTERRGKEEQ